MRAFNAIVGLTLRNAIRSHVFQLLLALLIFAVCVIPTSIGGGSPQDFIRVSLFYSIGAITLILALSSLWLGCFAMTRDVENYQLHMVVCKPVARWQIWLGKWVGINIINFVLLIISMLVVYFAILYRFNNEDSFSADDRQKIADEVLVGRRVYLPVTPDFEKIAVNYVDMLNQKRQKNGQPGYTQEEQDKLIKEAKQQLSSYVVLPESDKIKAEERAEAAKKGEVKLDNDMDIKRPGRWVFKGVPRNDSTMYLRYRPYLDQVSTEKQRYTDLMWGAWVSQGGAEAFAPFSTPQRVFSGEFHEFAIPGDWKIERADKDGDIILEVRNFDPNGGKHYYQTDDGPKLMVKICGFFGNYCRAVVVVMIQLLLLSGMACAFGGFLTMPTAIFMMVSYLLFGSIASLLTDDSYFISNNWDKMAQMLSHALLLIVIPLQAFDVTELLANGELIEFSFIGKLFLEYFLLRGVPLCLFGIWLYSRKELALAVRK